MSVQALSWAFRSDVPNPIEKFVLVALADYADEYGFCWPSQKTLAAACSCSERKVRSALSSLESRGLIERLNRRRPDGSYRSDVVVLVGFEARRICAANEPHPVLGSVYRKPTAAAVGDLFRAPHVVAQRPRASTQRHGVPVVQRHAVPEPAARGAGHEPPVYPPDQTTTGARPDWVAACLAVLGPGADRNVIGSTCSEIEAWAEAGFDLGLDVIPVIAARTRKARPSPIVTFVYFTAAVRERHASRSAKPRGDCHEEAGLQPVRPAKRSGSAPFSWRSARDRVVARSAPDS